MSIRRSPLFWLNIAALCIALAWLWVAPHRAWTRLLAVVETGDDSQLTASADMSRLADYLRSDLQTALQSQSGIASELLNGEGQATLLNTLVEAGSSPAGVRETVRSFTLAAPNADGSIARSRSSFRYISPIEVQVRVHRDGTPPDEAGVFTLKFSGSAWRLIRIRSSWLAGKG